MRLPWPQALAQHEGEDGVVVMTRGAAGSWA